jgi:arsenate reductase
MELTAQKMNKELKAYIVEATYAMESLPEERKETLKEIGEYLLADIDAGNTAKLIFICTHNSRRSHMAQIWFQTLASYYGIEKVASYSGGTEATKFHTNAIEAMKRAGFTIKPMPSPEERPIHSVYDGVVQQFVFSKKFDALENPQTDFAAVMVCSEADASCPIVRGASARFALPYEDPRYFDGSPSMEVKYDERVWQIAMEMAYTLDYVKDKLIQKEELTKN